MGKMGGGEKRPLTQLREEEEKGFITLGPQTVFSLGGHTYLENSRVLKIFFALAKWSVIYQ